MKKRLLCALAVMLLSFAACVGEAMPAEDSPTETMAAPMPDEGLDGVPEPVQETAAETETVTEAEAAERLGFVDGNISAGGELCGGEDGCIYFAGKSAGRYLYRAKPDGTEKTMLAEDRPKYINVLDGWVYYVNLTDGSAIYRIRTDGTDREKLTEEGCANLRVTENGMYYNHRPDPTVSQTTYHADLNGENIVKLAENRSVAAYHNGKLYCHNREALYRLDVDTGAWETIFEGYVDDVSADETGVYFSDVSGTRYDGQGGYYHRDKEGKLTMLVPPGHCDYYTYHDGTVYYTDYGGIHYEYVCLYSLDTVTGETKNVWRLSDQMYDMAGVEAGLSILEYREGLVESVVDPFSLIEECSYYTYVAGDRRYTDASLRDSMLLKGEWACWATYEDDTLVIWD